MCAACGHPGHTDAVDHGDVVGIHRAAANHETRELAPPVAPKEDRHRAWWLAVDAVKRRR